MIQIPSSVIMIFLVFCLAWALWMFARTREDAHLEVGECNFDDPRERYRELEAAFAAGMMTEEEFQRLAEKLGVNQTRQTSGVSSKSLPKTWDDLKK
ncbi:MAG: hypothetical protein ACKO85_16585 [Isosphaeraceae bacterium]